MDKLQLTTKNEIATKDQFLQSFTIKNCIVKFKSVSTPMLSLQTNAPSLALVKKLHSEDFILAYIEMWLIDLNDFLNVTRKMNEPQIKQTALFIIQEYYYYKISDLNLIFKRIKNGAYGILYESIDGAKILNYFSEYSKERVNSSIDLQENTIPDYKDDNHERSSSTVKIDKQMQQYKFDKEVKKQQENIKNKTSKK